MKATGIVRRVDELGRIVIPKELRRVLRIKEGDEMEIYTKEEGELILKRYSTLGRLKEHAGAYAETVADVLGGTVLITDTNEIIAAAGLHKAAYSGARLSQKMLELLDRRQQQEFGGNTLIKITPEDTGGAKCQIIIPITAHGDVYGSLVILLVTETASEAHRKVAQSAAGFLHTTVA